MNTPAHPPRPCTRTPRVARYAAALHAASLAVLAVLVSACGPGAAGAGSAAGGAGSSGGAASGERPMRARPSDRAMARAFERVAPDAQQCLRAGDPAVTVRGAFAGATGAFAVTAVQSAAGGPPPSHAVATCVRAASERAHVRAFRDARAEYEHTFLPAGAASANAAGNGAVASGNGGTGAAGSSTGTSSPALPVGGPTLQDLIDREANGFQQCYANEALARDHRVAGTVEVHLVLEASGAIARLTTNSRTTFEDPTLMELVARCVEQRVRAIAFPPQRDAGREYTFPLQFAPQ